METDSRRGDRLPPRGRGAFNLDDSRVLDVVVCDDERHIVRLIQVNLERRGHSVRVAFDGRECLDMVRKQVPDALILDEDMPYLDGNEVVQALRDDPATANLKIVLLRKSSDGKDNPGPPSFPGPSAVISKPFNPAHLLRELL